MCVPVHVYLSVLACNYVTYMCALYIMHKYVCTGILLLSTSFHYSSVLVFIQVREAWQNYELDLINYQNKCRLIRGWDDLFNKLKEHINSVAAMKLSPYFKVVVFTIAPSKLMTYMYE